MPMNLSGKSLLTLLDFSAEEIGYLLDLAASFKTMKYAGVPHRYLEGKNIVLLFEKTSTRTGMGVTYLDPGSSQMGKKESIEDTARVLGRMYDGIEYRGFEQSVVEELAANAGVPVWNGLTAQFHPTQALADILTMREEFGQSWASTSFRWGRKAMRPATARTARIFGACANSWRRRAARRFPSPTALTRACGASMPSTPMCGSAWANRLIYGRTASLFWSRIA